MILPEHEIQLPPRFSHDSPENYLNALVAFVTKYQWLAELHVNDFFTHGHWDLLDPSWSEALLPNSCNEDWFHTIIGLPADPSNALATWPSSLIHYINEAHELVLPRNVPHSIDNGKIGKYVKTGMTDKKIHEVELLGSLIHGIAKEHNISSILDIGSGQGYLSRTLAFDYKHKVLAVDMSEIQTKGAVKFDKRATKGLEKGDTSVQLHHVTEMITPSNVTSVLDRWGGGNREEEWLVCGLHTCGDLATLGMRLFARDDNQVTCLVNVGCCYHYLNGNGTTQGFPLSADLAQRQFQLDITSRVLACHAPWQWIQQSASCKTSFEQHFFKALLQYILLDKGLITRDNIPVLGRVKQTKDFPSYVKSTLKRIGIDQDAITEQEANQYYSQFKEAQADKQIIALWTLRSLMAQAIESLILVDRWFYLKNATKGGPNSGVWMWPLFDRDVSPRNVVFVAVK